jgi:catechol 2,3-dioxygenase-like lactoylglutathione lyase family enzyme
MSEPVTAKLLHGATTLLVRDLTAAVAYYRDALGFANIRLYGEQPDFGMLSRNVFHVMLKQIADPSLIVPRHKVEPYIWDIYYWVDDVETLFQEVRVRGATIAYEPCDKFYGCREFAVLDADGYSIGFGQVITPGGT